MIKQICEPDLRIPHKWFAWYPVSTTEVYTGTHWCHIRIWWEWVWRTKDCYYGTHYFREKPNPDLISIGTINHG